MKRLQRALVRTLHDIGIDVRRWPAVSESLPNFIHLLHHHSVDVVLDVGANVGQYSKELRRGGYANRIVSFEPSSDSHDDLSKATAADPRWIAAERMALGAETGEQEITRYNRSDMNSFLPLSETGSQTYPRLAALGTETVKIQRLDDIIGSFTQDDDTIFLKIDTQGYERPVLEGAADCLQRITGVQLEMSIVALYDQRPSFFTLSEYLRQRGFELAMITPNTYSKQLGKQIEVDAVFTRVPH